MTHAPGIQPGLWLKYYRAIADLERAKRLAMQPVRDIKKQISAVKRAAERDGANLFAMTMLDNLTRQSEDVVMQGMIDLDHYAHWAALPIGTQGKLFAEPAADEVLEHDEWLAESEGREVAAAGGARNSNPHELHSQMWQRWDQGWCSAPPPVVPMPELDVPVDPPRKRGRPKGSRNKTTKATTVVARLRRAHKEAASLFGF